MNGHAFYQKLIQDPQCPRLHPQLAAFLKDYLSHEKVRAFGEQWVINTHLPPYPSSAFSTMLSQFGDLGQAAELRHLFSGTLAVTNRCPYGCWHCYNAGRSQEDLSLDTWQRIIGELQGMGIISVTLSGGEPLLRTDLEEIVASFGERCFLCLNTTGYGLTPEPGCSCAACIRKKQETI